jgi:hypothetical protein
MEAKMKYKTKDGGDVFIPGVGTTVGGVIETNVLIENPNMVQVDDTAAAVTVDPTKPTGIVGTVTAAPGAVTEATLVKPQEDKEPQA